MPILDDTRAQQTFRDSEIQRSRHRRQPYTYEAACLASSGLRVLRFSAITPNTLVQLQRVVFSSSKTSCLDVCVARHVFRKTACTG